MDASMKVGNVRFEIFSVRLPRDPVYAGSRISLEGEIRHPEKTDVNMMQKRGKTLFSFSFCRFPYTIQAR